MAEGNKSNLEPQNPEMSAKTKHDVSRFDKFLGFILINIDY